jgi:hypothetical protein
MGCRWLFVSASWENSLISSSVSSVVDILNSENVSRGQLEKVDDDKLEVVILWGNVRSSKGI